MKRFLVFFAMVATSIAQPQLTVSVPTATGGLPATFADWQNGVVNLIYPDQTLISIRIADGNTVSSYALPEPTATYYGDGTGKYEIISCAAPDGRIATAVTTSGDVSAVVTNVQVTDPTTGVTQTTTPLPFMKYGQVGACAFTTEGLVLSADVPNVPNPKAFTRTLPSVILLDSAMNPLWVKPTGGGESIAAMAVATGSTSVYTLGQSTCSLSGSGCATSIGIVASDGSYTQVVSQATLPPTTSLAVAPNGLLLAGGKIFDPTTGTAPASNIRYAAGYVPAITWPIDDPWYAYTAYGSITGINILGGGVNVTFLPNLGYMNVFAQRQSDGTDLVIGQRDGAIDFYRVTPPALIYGVANAASIQMGQPIAPGSIITIFGQGLGAPGEADCADTTKIVTKIANTQVFVDNVPIQLLYVGSGQVNAALPRSLSLGSHTIQVRNGATFIPMGKPFTVVDQAIAAFMWAPDPTKPTATAPIVTNQAYQVLGPPPIVSASATSANLAATPSAASGSHPQAQANDVVTIWATGGGLTNPLLDDSIAVAPMIPLPLIISPQVLVDGNPVVVLYAGLAPGNTPGLNQVNFVVPAGLASGPHDMTLGTMKYPGSLWIK